MLIIYISFRSRKVVDDYSVLFRMSIMQQQKPFHKGMLLWKRILLSGLKLANEFKAVGSEVVGLELDVLMVLEAVGSEHIVLVVV